MKMKPLLKKVLAAVAIKQGIDKVNEMRRPKRSAWARLGPVLALLGIGGALAYLAGTNKLNGVVEKAKSMTGNSDHPEVVLEDSLRTQNS